MVSVENTPQQRPSPVVRYILVGIIVILAALIGWFTYKIYEARYGGEPFGLPFTLVDQNGAEITEAAFTGHPSMIFFGFTNCPEICPTTLAEMDGWLKEMGAVAAYFLQTPFKPCFGHRQEDRRPVLQPGRESGAGCKGEHGKTAADDRKPAKLGRSDRFHGRHCTGSRRG